MKQSKVIQCTRMDCFTSFAMTAHVTVIVFARSCGELRGMKQSKAIQCTRMDCFTSFAKTAHVTAIVIANPQGEAIQRIRMDCFLLRTSQSQDDVRDNLNCPLAKNDSHNTKIKDCPSGYSYQ
jgi:hypothetical protein